MAVTLTKFLDPQVTTLAVSKVNTLPGTSKKTLSFPDKSVASMQPDGRIESRPEGTAGLYEQCEVDGQVATWSYASGDQPVGPFTVAFVLVSGQ